MVINQPQFNPKKKNKVNPIIIMGGVAIVLGLAAAIGVGQYLTNEQSKNNDLVAKRSIIIATRDLTPGSKLTTDDIASKEVSAESIPPNAPSNLNVLINRELKSPVFKDEIITELKLIPFTAGSGIPSVLPPGTRAITLRINDIIGVGGHLKPGDFVDILSVYKADGETQSKAIFENVRVLAIGSMTIIPQPPTSSGAPAVQEVSTTVTVVVSPEDAEKLFLASNSGQFQFSLRPYGDNVTVASAGSNLEDVYGYIANPTYSRKKSKLRKTKGYPYDRKNVEVILGSVRSYETFLD